MTINNPKRPNCPKCGNELVFVAAVILGTQYSFWACDCDSSPNPAFLKRDIVLCRDWDEQAIVIKLDVEEEDEA